MAPTHPSDSSSEEEEYEYRRDNEAEQQEGRNREEEEEEEFESEEDEEEGEETPPVPPPLDKRPSLQKPNPTTTDEEGFDSESDDSEKTQPSPTASDFAIKPISNKSAPKPAAKRPAQTGQDGMDSRAKKKRVSNGDEDNGERKSLFSRLWSEDDEIAILKGMLEYKVDQYTNMGDFHEFIKESLHVEVSKSQLTDKIKRMKKKYVTNAEKGENPVFSKSHDHKSFELSKKIWGAVAGKGIDDNAKSSKRTAKSSKRTPKKSSTINHHPLSLAKEEKHEFDPLNSGIKASQEDFLKMYPRLNESLQSEKGLYSSLLESGRNFLKERISLIGSAKAEKLEEKWNNLQVDEIELYLKHVELIREQTKLVLAEMKSSK